MWWRGNRRSGYGVLPRPFARRARAILLALRPHVQPSRKARSKAPHGVAAHAADQRPPTTPLRPLHATAACPALGAPRTLLGRHNARLREPRSHLTSAGG